MRVSGQQRATDDHLRPDQNVKTIEDLPLVLDTSDIMRVMGIGETALLSLLKRPDFPAQRSGKRKWRVHRDAFVKWLSCGMA